MRQGVCYIQMKEKELKCLPPFYWYAYNFLISGENRILQKNTPHTTKYDEKKSKKSRADTHYRQFYTSHETAPPNRTILQKKKTN